MKKKNCGLCLAGCIIFYILIFVLQRLIVFVADDIWYGTNLVTGQKLSGIADIIESQVWHYNNWGGRSINHAVLQLVLMGGEFFDDILNTVMCAVLSFLIIKIADAKKLVFFLFSTVLLIILNPAFYGNMFWQSGTANYLYSTCWIFCFSMIYLKELEGKGIASKTGVAFWMPLLGLVTGWSCENMGPASFILATGVTLYLWMFMKKRPKVWMIEGIVTSFAGSCLMILAPGNFVRSSLIDDSSLAKFVQIRIESMKTATFDFLLPAFVIAFGVTFVYLFVCREKLSKKEISLAAYAITAHLGMSLSPTYPSRAVFGIVAIMIVYIISLSAKICENSKSRKTLTAVGITLYAIGIWQITPLILYPPYAG